VHSFTVIGVRGRTTVRESGAILGGCCGGRRGGRERCALRWRRDRDGPSSMPRVLACRLASPRALLRRGPSVLSRMSSPSPSRSLRWLMVYPEKIGAASIKVTIPGRAGRAARARPGRRRTGHANADQQRKKLVADINDHGHDRSGFCLAEFGGGKGIVIPERDLTCHP
jgi:hypothetical protein